MASNTNTINSLWGSLLIEELVRNNVIYFVISPGSRSTPLTLAIARHAQTQTTVCFDERAAAFHALGYARATGQPAVLVCTSGTAAANYYPAVIEAATDAVPLIILSADRPPELHQTGANQTIQQRHLYGRHVQWEFELPCPDFQIAPQMPLTTVDQVVYRARRAPGGPVHLNCQFREPLAPTDQTSIADMDGMFERDYLAPLQNWQARSTAYSHYGQSVTVPLAPDITHLAETLNQTQRGLLVVGQLAHKAEQQAVLTLAKQLNWPVFADIQSGLRLNSTLPTIVPYFDQLWLLENYQQWSVETVLQIGGRLISKRFLQWLTHHPPQQHIVIANNPERHDPAHTVSLRLEADLGHLMEPLLPQLHARGVETWVTELVNASQHIHSIVDQVLLSQSAINEPAIARLVSRQLPPGHGLYLANSMPIRDMDMYGAPEGNIKIVGCDRGTSGIEGAIAAAAGFAMGQQTPVTLLVGDLSLLHDLNSLAVLKSLAQPVIVIVINNDGGGIFSFLPVAQCDDVFEPYFGVPHDLTFKTASQMFTLDYYCPQTLADFTQVYTTALDHQCSAVIEVVTDRHKNLALHQTLQQQIVKELQPATIPV
ncbi:2-succinyl-5-enolpyruvyl-6-hydroxy-3-cyclohexene-1-carboxylic-acid synthase [Leptothoe spongobia]|uniref:2-succinyl-5-enolpyruvyl-6-hydroxy-3-cyclohexene-1-carboxylate synthase n=1 Tax=Leptothoe spongobia TAU-MAC 1115 TaxID=1967444 RepID=A0A947DFQ5_9CYAN|nr:2-succinyl-5-enolpyruvyl-6-hydroxy-3-cyclohexene-1-carboxylic-acid synthase [Leptothoe spongobia]MBT9315814.1 2-succinyl-5-enolpyruvyl-6-hydroxy-3-cyclohexene-1-carboxylic-acid synthase [Leptothoe spongobia TAU-MAC 1115]